MSDTLPPLPEPDTHCWDDDFEKDVWSHSDEAMRAYGEACAAAERERIRRALEDMQAACRSHNYYAHAITAAGLTDTPQHQRPQSESQSKTPPTD